MAFRSTKESDRVQPNPRIGAVCSADPNDIHALAGDFAYKLRQFIKTDRNGERRRAFLAGINDFEKACGDPEASSASR